MCSWIMYAAMTRAVSFGAYQFIHVTFLGFLQKVISLLQSYIGWSNHQILSTGHGSTERLHVTFWFQEVNVTSRDDS